MGFERKIDTASIVLVGDFNPRVFHPDWFRREGLIRDAEAETALARDNCVVASNLANFQAGPFEVQVTADRFVARVSNEPDFQLLQDLVVGTFDILRDFPIRLLGLNRMMHYELDSADEWHQVGDTLLPKAPWNDVLEEPGMLTAQLQGTGRIDGVDHTRVKVQPSSEVETGVYFDFNEQYGATDTAADEDGMLLAADFVPIVRDEWEAALEHAGEAADSLLENILDDDEQ